MGKITEQELKTLKELVKEEEIMEQLNLEIGRLTTEVEILKSESVQRAIQFRGALQKFREGLMANYGTVNVDVDGNIIKEELETGGEGE